MCNANIKKVKQVFFKSGVGGRFLFLFFILIISTECYLKNSLIGHTCFTIKLRLPDKRYAECILRKIKSMRNAAKIRLSHADGIITIFLEEQDLLIPTPSHSF